MNCHIYTWAWKWLHSRVLFLIFLFFSIHFPYLHISYNDDVLFLHLEKNLIKINNTLYLSNISSHFTLQEITKLTLSLHIFLSCIAYLSNIIWTSFTAEIWQISPYSLCLPCPILLSLIYFFPAPKKKKKCFVQYISWRSLFSLLLDFF